ncbi:hypothetical protein ACWDV7_33750 [Streptomyces sp. NPDC003362]
MWVNTLPRLQRGEPWYEIGVDAPDRSRWSTTSTPVTIQSDGALLTDPITFDDIQSWYTDRHYVAVNLYNSININTQVYQVTTAPGA